MMMKFNNRLVKDKISQTDRGGTLTRLLLHATPRLKEPGKARQKSPSAINQHEAFPASFKRGPVLQKPPPVFRVGYFNFSHFMPFWCGRGGYKSLVVGLIKSGNLCFSIKVRQKRQE